MKTKQAAHTPGPLEVMQNDPRLCVRGTENLYSVVRRPASCVIETVAENLTFADAKLYAAAPDLLEACQRVSGQDVPPEVIDAIRAAIAKAEGGK